MELDQVLALFWCCLGGATFELSFPIEATATNNQAEYQALLKGIQLLREIKADAVEIFTDSMLVINQLIGEYECKDDILRVYHRECCRLLKEFKKVTIEHVPKLYNGDANWLAQHAYGYRPMGGVMTLELPADDFWPTMLEDCFTYYKGCQGCQKFGNVQRAPASAMNPIIKLAVQRVRN